MTIHDPLGSHPSHSIRINWQPVGFSSCRLTPCPNLWCVKDLHVQSRDLSEDPGSGGVSTAEAGQQNITLAMFHKHILAVWHSLIRMSHAHYTELTEITLANGVHDGCLSIICWGHNMTCTIQNLTNISGLVTFGLFCCSILLLLLGWLADGCYLCHMSQGLRNCGIFVEMLDLHRDFLHPFVWGTGRIFQRWGTDSSFAERVGSMNGRKVGGSDGKWQYLWF